MSQPLRRADRVTALNRQAVAQAAVAMVAEAGFGELTVRGVARRLAVSAPSLYEYVANKDDLIDLVVAHVLEAAATDWKPPVDWEELIRYAGLWWHRVLREHEAVYTSVLRQPLAAPVALDTVERVLIGLTEAGFTEREAVAAYAQLFGFVVGITALVRVREIGRNPADATGHDARQRTLLALDALDDSRYPGISACRVPLAELATEAVVSNGLEALIAGLRDRRTP